MTLACLAAGPVMLLLGAGILAMFYLLTLYMQLVRGYPALHTGLAYLPVIVGTGVAVGVAPRLLMKASARAVIAAGLILYAGAMLWCASQLTPASDYFAVILPALLVAGAGSGLVFVAATAVAVHGVAPRDSGVTQDTGVPMYGAGSAASPVSSAPSATAPASRAGRQHVPASVPVPVSSVPVSSVPANSAPPSSAPAWVPGQAPASQEHAPRSPSAAPSC